MYRDLIYSRSLRFVTAILISSSAFADSVTEQSFLQEFPVVLTASRLSQPLSESPNSMTIIDQQMIRASGFRSVVDLFRLVPGMYVGNAGANLPFVSLNGVTDQYSRRMQVLVDGRSVYLPPFGGVDWSGLPLLIEDIERIEVVRGPSAASHGTNSFYGVINIITKEVLEGDVDRIALSKGDMGMTGISTQHTRSGERMDYRLSGNYQTFDGDNPQVLNDGSRARTFTAKSDFRASTADNVEFQFGIRACDAGKGIKWLNEDPFRTAVTQNDYQQLSWIHSWDAGGESKLGYYRIYSDYKDPRRALDWSTASIVFGEDKSKSLRQDLELQNTSQLGNNNRIVWGGGIRHDFAELPLIFQSTHRLKQIRVFIHDEWRMLESTVFNFGTMFENDGAGHRTNSPRVSVNHHINSRHTLRASYSTATRNPVMAEMYLTTETKQYWRRGYVPPLQELRPEKITSREIGYVGQFDRWSLDGRLYAEHVKDIVGLDYFAVPATQKHSFKNLTDGNFKGLELMLAYRWDDGFMNLNFARQQTNCNFSSYPTQYFNTTPIPTYGTVANAYQVEILNLCSESVPVNSASLLFSQHWSEDVNFSTGYYFRDSVRVGDVASGYPAESPMHRVDMRLAQEFGQKERPGGGEIAVVLQNVFQDNYTAYGNVTEAANLLFKRRTYLTASIHF